MRQTKPKGTDKINRGILRMLAFHARGFHLAHVRRYHAERKARQKSYDKTNPAFGKPSRRWTLPLYLEDISRLSATAKAGQRGVGWTQFLRWKFGMVAVADIRKNLVVSRLATGKSAMVQYRIAERILSSVSECEDFRVVYVPLLHFRALVYLRRRKRDKQKIVVPLVSPIAPLDLGRKYTGAFVRDCLEKALAHRIRSAIEGRRRTRTTTSANDSFDGRTI
jgi:hypothetical protein